MRRNVSMTRLTFLCAALGLSGVWTAHPEVAVAQEKAIVLKASTIFDGRGHILHDTRIAIENGRIARLDSRAEGVTYDLRGLTVLPGWIDVHDHITWHFGPNGRVEDKEETPAQAALAEAGNAWTTLLAGFTTIQSLGSPEDQDLRAAIDKGALAGPNSRSGQATAGRWRRRGQDFCLAQHSRGRRTDAQRRTVAGSLRRGKSPGAAQCCSCLSVGSSRGGARRMHASGARYLCHRRRPAGPGGARDFLRPPGRAGDPQLSRSQGEFPGHRELYRRRICQDARGPAAQSGNVQACSRYQRT